MMLQDILVAEERCRIDAWLSQRWRCMLGMVGTVGMGAKSPFRVRPGITFLLSMYLFSLRTLKGSRLWVRSMGMLGWGTKDDTQEDTMARCLCRDIALELVELGLPEMII